MDLKELKEIGWTYVDGVTNSNDLIDIGREIGSITMTPNNELVKKITRFSKSDAPKGSQSALYGTGRFPLHTDTVFWELPVKYVILRAHGDVRRPTTLKDIESLFQICDKKYLPLIINSIWYVGQYSKRFYCSLRFNYKDSAIWRIDMDLMKPANKSAIESQKVLRDLVFTTDTESINWTGSNAVIISNWRVLHGRGNSPENEGQRTIERLYVR